MAEFVGHVIPNLETIRIRDHVSSSVVFDTVYPKTKKYDVIQATYLYGSNAFVKQGKYSTTLADQHYNQDFFTDFYSKFYIFPLTLDLGGIVNQVNGNVKLWNANVVGAQIDSYTSQGIADEDNFYIGFSDETYPITFVPLEDKSFLYSMAKDGSYLVYGVIDLDTSTNDLTLPVIASRAQFFVPSPLKKIIHTYRFKTQVTESYNHEQRSALAEMPLEEFEYSASLSEVDRLAIERSFVGNPVIQFVMPMWDDYIFVPTILAGTTIIHGDFDGYSFSAGETVILWIDEANNQTAKIYSVTDTMLTFDSPIIEELNNVFVMPARTAISVDGFKITRSKANRTIIKGEWETLNTHPEFINNAVLPTLNGRPVLAEPNFTKTNNESLRRSIGDYEGDGALKDYFVERGYPEHRSKYTWQCFNRQQLNMLRKFIFTVRGKWKSFYLPRSGRDFILVNESLLGVKYLDCAKGAIHIRDVDLINKALYVGYLNGTKFFANITTVQRFDDYIRLHFDDNLPHDTDVNNVACLCMMDLVRMAQDRFSVTFRDVDNVVCKLSVIGVNYD